MNDLSSPSAGASPGAISRALQLLSVLADSSGTVSVKQVAEQMQLAPSTVHRLLQLLRKEGFVQAAAEGRQYSVGPQYYRVSARVMALVGPLDIVRPLMEDIAQEFNEAVLFGLYQAAQGAVSFIGRADGQQRLQYQIDMYRAFSLVWGASGKAILAYLPEATIEAIWENEGPSPASGAKRPELKDLLEELAAIRERGFAESAGEKLPDAHGIAAPVFGPRGIIGCLCMTSPSSRLPAGGAEGIGRRMAVYGADASRLLGALPSQSA